MPSSSGTALVPNDGACARARAARRHRACPRQGRWPSAWRFEQSMDKVLQRRRVVEQELRVALGREVRGRLSVPIHSRHRRAGRCGAGSLAPSGASQSRARPSIRPMTNFC